MRILLLGGSKSGKSMLAQTLSRTLAGSGTMYYWATMEPTDAEDEQRIARHLTERDGWGFRTVECGRNLPAACQKLERQSTILFDSVTACLANEMFGEKLDAEASKRTLNEVLTVSKFPAHFVCVCDEIWRDGESYDEWTECYRRGLAQICRGLAEQFDAVCEVTAGVCRLWKGELPK